MYNRAAIGIEKIVSLKTCVLVISFLMGLSEDSAKSIQRDLRQVRQNRREVSASISHGAQLVHSTSYLNVQTSIQGSGICSTYAADVSVSQFTKESRSRMGGLHYRIALS